MELRVWEVRGSECRPAMGRIGIEGIHQHHPTRKGADFWPVSNCKRVCGTFEGGQANDGHIGGWCGLRPNRGLARH